MRRVAAALLLVLFTVTASVPLRQFVLPEIVRLAYELEGRDLVYSWGGGHAEDPGPSNGTCRGYHGSIKPCPAQRTRGLDCSGFTRWVYALAHGKDVLGRGTPTTMSGGCTGWSAHAPETSSTSGRSRKSAL